MVQHCGFKQGNFYQTFIAVVSTNIHSIFSSTHVQYSSVFLLQSISSNMPAISFSEDVLEDETGRGAENSIVVCNGLEQVVYVELQPIETVRRDKARGKELSLGADVAAGGANAKVIIIVNSASQNSSPIFRSRPCVIVTFKLFSTL